MIQKEFIPYEEALLLKELGFDEPCIKQYLNDGEIIFCVDAWGYPTYKTNIESNSDSGGTCISALTFSQAFRWFRENYMLSGAVIPTTIYFKDSTMEYTYDIRGNYTSSVLIGKYEDAEIACLRKLIQIVKQKS
jgi:hypothetical protein